MRADPSFLLMGTEGSLTQRTRQVLGWFDREEKGHGFTITADGTYYAKVMADLLDEWLVAIPGDPKAPEGYVFNPSQSDD